MLPHFLEKQGLHLAELGGVLRVFGEVALMRFGLHTGEGND